MKRTQTFMWVNYLVFFGFATWQVLFNNYAVERFDASATQIGLAQSIREIPGLLVFTVSFIAIFLSEIRIACAAVLLVGSGILLCGLAPSFGLLLLATFLLSIGFHYFYAVQQSVGAKLTVSGSTAHFLTRQRSLTAFATVSAGLAVYGLFRLYSYTGAFALVGGLLSMAGIFLLTTGRQCSRPVKRPRVRLRKRYATYYAMHFLMGLRRHIFTTFAIFLLVKRHGVPAGRIILLMFVANLIGAFLFRYYGHIINALGGKNTMRLEFGLLSVLFVLYAHVDTVPILFGLYVVDALLFGFNPAIDVYLKSIVATRDDTSMTVSAGFAINHITAIVIPVVGGLLWDHFSYRLPFYLGSAVAVFSVAFISCDRLLMKALARHEDPAPAG